MYSRITAEAWKGERLWWSGGVVANTQIVNVYLGMKLARQRFNANLHIPDNYSFTITSRHQPSFMEMKASNHSYMSFQYTLALSCNNHKRIVVVP